MGRRLLTTKEVSDLTRIPVGTLENLRSQQEGPPAFRLGRRVFYEENDLWAWIDAQKNPDGPPEAG